MVLENVVPLKVSISGTAVAGVNLGWKGIVTADAPFVTLILVRKGSFTWWSKTSVPPNSDSVVSLFLHPLNFENTSVQFLFYLNGGIVQEVCASIKSENFLAPSPTTLHFFAGQLGEFCTIASNPKTSFELFFLARSNISLGRTGVWRPHKNLSGAFPGQLESALFGRRNGSFSH